ncbi:P-loop containing nucleoside triphosphate hydrolase protein [Podospora didyma]|uniref:P-loop containing nucleoside triphosphate hydrolase protein n=1 Tax=Podospora didyma TaxID=330526 RepID=A0AAE0N8G0_9PEZI|nr:P-loop containing nucleoside triphosphate hydrolase protein [Podospora didyma]
MAYHNNIGVTPAAAASPPASHFVLPPKRKAVIPIINPNSGQPLQASSVPLTSQGPQTISQNAMAEQKLAQARSKVAKSAAMATAAIVGRDLGAAQRRADRDEEEGFDVYAAPFVPTRLANINSRQGVMVSNTPPANFIDFDRYVQSWAGASLLPPPHGLEYGSRLPRQQTETVGINPRQYGAYFRSLITAEMLEKIREDASYALYEHIGLTKFVSSTQAEVSIVVPGLREDRPCVEEDDEVQLRQLCHDSNGILLPETELVPFQPSPCFPYPPPPPQYIPRGPWTEIVYNARVTAVIRARETLMLRVEGLTCQTADVPNGAFPSDIHVLKFNVLFHSNVRRTPCIRRALSQIQAALDGASETTISSQRDDVPVTASGGVMSNEYWIQSMLFPTEADSAVQANFHSGIFADHFFDADLNVEQRVAVENVCRQNYGVMPYLISGPPGTGKTKTLIEIALQLTAKVSNVSHILVCAPSEQATDTLADRLRSFLQPNELLRLNRPTRAFAEVDDKLLPYCFVQENRFDLPPMPQLMQYKVVVTSCRDADMLQQGRLTNEDLFAAEHGFAKLIHQTTPRPSQARLHWDALLVDEAAQATEPESLIPLCVVTPPPGAPKLAFTPLLVMVGDEHQLNPRTSLAHTPLQRSLFARLFARPVYANHPLARHFAAFAASRSTTTSLDNTSTPSPIDAAPAHHLPELTLPILRPAFTNLIQNYRSHPAILAVPSQLFYHDTLIPAASPSSTSRLSTWGGWRGHNWPVLFHDTSASAIDDLERQTGGSGLGAGWINHDEAVLACTYAADLLGSKLVTQNDVCIMSPFSAQVNCIRRIIRSKRFNFWNVNVGPTEAFQGLEHGVVILCTTRSRQRFVKNDQKVGWGLVGRPNQLNVALTRAKFGLIVLGNRELLVTQDESWKAVVAFCERNGLVADTSTDGKDKTTKKAEATGRVTNIERALLEEEQRRLEEASWPPLPSSATTNSS